MGCFDLITGVWEVVAPMGTARDIFRAATIGCKIYVMDGTDSGFKTFSSVEHFDPTMGQMGNGRLNGERLVYGGVLSV